jgi:transcription elongation GreA/GreB family factor
VRTLDEEIARDLKEAAESSELTRAKDSASARSAPHQFNAMTQQFEFRLRRVAQWSNARTAIVLR